MFTDEKAALIPESQALHFIYLLYFFLVKYIWKIDDIVLK